MAPEQIVSQFQQILSALQRIIDASAALEARIDSLEQGSGDLVGKLTDVQGNLVILLETYQSHAESQRDLNDRLTQSVSALEDRVAALEQSH